MPTPHTLLCTVGTSLLYPNLSRLVEEPQSDPIRAGLAQAYADENWEEVAIQLHKIAPAERLCGAEINSVTDLLTDGKVERVNLHLLHSETDDGRAIAQILQFYFEADEWQVQVHCVDGLRDDEPRLFRTHGLRNLAKIFGEQVRQTGADFCAINATGGYKAQIAIAVLMGQALDIPVYYKHERFNAIIPFPPMPVALDFSLWEQASGMFMVLSRPNACEPWKQFEEDWDERFEPLVNRERIDGEDYLELSATGQIFHETFRSRFQAIEHPRLPRPATEDAKEAPKLGQHAYGEALERILRFLTNLTQEVPYIRYCYSTYWNPDLPEATRFRKSAGTVEGIYSNGTWCVKFRVVTTADDRDLESASVIVAYLNNWLDAKK